VFFFDEAHLLFDGATPPKSKRSRRREPSPGGRDEIGDFLGSREGKALQRKLARGLFGLLRKRL
jgi:hypothetical protein